MTEYYFTIGDATYYYTVKGEGEALLLFHGFTGTSETWGKFVGPFSRDFQVITVDLPGHGKTICKTPRTMERFSADIVKLLQSLQHKKVHLLGYSLGGRTALSFAMYYPEMVKTLIVESASPGLKKVEERHSRMAQDRKRADMILTEGMHAFVDYWEDIPLFDTQKQLPKKVQEKIRTERLSQTEQGLANSLKSMGTGIQPSWWEKLDTLKQPVLLLVGEADEKFVEINQAMEKLLPNSELAWFKNTGHAIHVEQPEKFVTIVREFLIQHKDKRNKS